MDPISISARSRPGTQPPPAEASGALRASRARLAGEPKVDAAPRDPFARGLAFAELADPLPPLPPAALRALEAIDDTSEDLVLGLVLESDQALRHGLALADPHALAEAAAAANATRPVTRTERVLAPFGALERMHEAQMAGAFLALCGADLNAQRQMLGCLERSQERLIDGAQARQKAVREDMADKAAALERTARWTGVAQPVAKVAAAGATGVVLATGGPVGLALAGLGAALGAVGSAGWQRSRQGSTAGLGATAARGALVGATLASALGGPALAWWTGAGAFGGAATGLAGGGTCYGLEAWEVFGRATQAGSELILGTCQFAQDRRALAVRNSEAQLRIGQQGVDQFGQLRQAALDGMTRLVERRRNTLSQVAQLLGRRHQATVRIQARMRH